MMHRRGGAVSRLQHQRLQVPLHQVRGSCQSLRAGSDHHDGQAARLDYHAILPLKFLDASTIFDASRFVN